MLRFLGFPVALVVVLMGCPLSAPVDSGAAKAASRMVISGVHVVDVVNGSILRDQAIVIDGSRIASIGPASRFSASDGDQLVEMAGGYAVPGFVEMHAHLLTHPWREDGELATQFDWRATTEMLADLVKYGVTTVRDPGAPTEAAIQLRRLVADGDVLGPEIKTAGRILIQSRFDPSPFAPVFDEADVVHEIEWQAKNGVDFIKVYGSMTPELVAAAVAEAGKRNIPVIAHAQRTTWTEAARLGVSGVSHPSPWSEAYVPEAAREGMEEGFMWRVDWLERVDTASSAVREMIAEMAARGVYNDVTLIAMHTKFFGNSPRWTENQALAEVPPAFLAGWRSFTFTGDWTPDMYARAQAAWPKMEAWVRALHTGGVMLTVGTDTPTPWIVPGVGMHDEMELLVEAGIPAADVLRMATLNGAKAMKLDDRIGSLDAGKEADIVVLSGDPTTDIAATRGIRLVVMNGTAWEPKEIDAVVDRAQAH